MNCLNNRAVICRNGSELGDALAMKRWFVMPGVLSRCRVEEF